MNIIELTSIDDAALKSYTSLTEAQLRSSDDPIFIAESPKVISTALDMGYEPVSMLCERKHIKGDAAPLLERISDIDVFTGSRDLLARLTGYTLTRGVLCAMRRPEPLSIESVCANSKRLAVIDSVVDTTNVGSIFRSAVALGVDGIILTPQSCDPLNRRVVRVSMGTVFRIPWTRCDCSPEELKAREYMTIAMALTPKSVSPDNLRIPNDSKIAIFLGNEGDGLSKEVIDACDKTVCIPMSRGVDSLNVGAAAAVAFWQFCRKY